MKSNRDTEETFAQRLDETLDVLDGLRQENLQRLRTVQAAKSRSLEKEKNWLASRLGKDHPRVKAMANRIAMQSERLAAVDEEIEKSKIQVPEIDTQTWMVHGRVLDGGRKPIKGLTIGLGDEKGKWIRELGYTCTDERGYFSLQCKFSSAEETATTGRISKTTTSAAGASFLKQAVYLLVTDQYQRILHRDSEALCPEPNRIDYREIILKDQVICTPPPGGETPSIVDAKVWKVYGRIADDAGKSVSGATIRVFDKDSRFGDKLGTCRTNDKGEFEIQYNSSDFGDLIAANPDIYLKVTDADGNVLHTTKQAVRFAAGHADAFNIQISRRQTPSAPAGETKIGDTTKKTRKKPER